MPPATEVTVHSSASRNHWSRRASTMGTSSTSGGKGKNELSAKEITLSQIAPAGLPAFASAQRYVFSSNFAHLALNWLYKGIPNGGNTRWGVLRVDAQRRTRQRGPRS